jgi:MoaA/NifB/PqqE/SkfB family radical SAM enzyme
MKAQDELRTADFAKLFADTELFSQLQWLYISGGEPFLRQDLPEIVTCIHECNPSTSIFIATNGFLTEKILETTAQLLTIHPRIQIGVSLDGLNDRHDTIRGVKNAFNKAERTLHALRTTFPHLPIQITTTVTPVNLDQVPLMYNFARQNRFHSRIAPAIHAQYFSNAEQDLTWSPQDIQTLQRYFQIIKRDLLHTHGKFSTIYCAESFLLDESIKYLRDPTNRSVPCFACFTRLYIDPYGNVYPCYNYYKKLGNIRTHPLRTIWVSDQAHAVRNEILHNQCPNCWIVHEAAADITNDHFRKYRYLLT